MGAVVALTAARERRTLRKEESASRLKRAAQQIQADPKAAADRALEMAIIGAWPHRYLLDLVRERFFQCVEWHLLRQKLAGEPYDYSLAVAQTMQDIRHAVPEKSVEIRAVELLTMMATESKP